jgi:hypothetical protein
MYKQRSLEISPKHQMIWSEDQRPVLCPVSASANGARHSCTPVCASYEVVEHDPISTRVSGGTYEVPGRTEVVCKMGGFIIGLLVEPKKEG